MNICHVPTSLIIVPISSAKLVGTTLLTHQHASMNFLNLCLLIRVQVLSNSQPLIGRYNRWFYEPFLPSTQTWVILVLILIISQILTPINQALLVPNNYLPYNSLGQNSASQSSDIVRKSTLFPQKSQSVNTRHQPAGPVTGTGWTRHPVHSKAPSFFPFKLRPSHTPPSSQRCWSSKWQTPLSPSALFNPCERISTFPNAL